MYKNNLRLLALICHFEQSEKSIFIKNRSWISPNVEMTGFFCSIVLLLVLFRLPVNAQSLTPDDAQINITLVDKNNIPEQMAKMELENQATGKIYTCITDTAGKCNVIIPQGAKYNTGGYIYGKPFDFPKSLDIPDVDGPINFDYNLKIINENFYKELFKNTYTLEKVFFETNSAKLKKESLGGLGELYVALKGNPKMEIEIAGHTDNVGDDSYNLKLSHQRASSVISYLVEHGIEKERLAAKGYGETQPIADNDTPEGRAKNRRTEVRIIRQ